MNKQNLFEKFVYLVFPLTIMFLGTLGNILGIIILKKRKLKQIGTTNMHVYFLTSDTICLIAIIKPTLDYLYGFDVGSVAVLPCKLFAYFNYTASSIPPMLLTYISFERFILIRHPIRKHILRREQTQMIYFICVVLINLAFYAPVLKEYDLKLINASNVTFLCTFEHKNIPVILVTINKSILSNCLILLSSILLIHTIFKSRKRTVSNYTFRENVLFRRDIKLAITSVVNNLFYILIFLPLLVLHFFFQVSRIVFVLSYQIFLLSYGMNFYLILITNNLIRNEFLTFILLRKRPFREEKNKKDKKLRHEFLTRDKIIISELN